jgi:hypothetical protein
LAVKEKPHLKLLYGKFHSMVPFSQLGTVLKITHKYFWNHLVLQKLKKSFNILSRAKKRLAGKKSLISS